MFDFIKKLINKAESKKADRKKPIPKERIESAIPAAKVEPPKPESKPQAPAPKLEVIKFTEAYKSTDPLDQIDQILTFYNKFTVGKEFYLKYKTPITAECPDLLLKQIYTAQECYINHLNRLPNGEELRLCVWIDNPQKMSEVLADMPKSLIKYNLALRALSIDAPLIVNTNTSFKPIRENLSPLLTIGTVPSVAAPTTPAKVEVKRFTETFKSTNPVDQIDQIVKFYNSFRPGKEYYTLAKITPSAACPDILLQQIYLAQEWYITHLGRLPYAIELTWCTYVGTEEQMLANLKDHQTIPFSKESIVEFAMKNNLPVTANLGRTGKTI